MLIWSSQVKWVRCVFQVEVLPRQATSWRLGHPRGAGRVRRAVADRQRRRRLPGQHGRLPERHEGHEVGHVILIIPLAM